MPRNVWETIKSVAGCDVQHGDFHRNVHYPDEMTYSLVSAAASVLKLTSDEVLETVGRQFLHFLKEHGYESTMRFQGNTFHQWIKNVNEPHRLLRSRFPKSRLPEFWSEEDESDPSKQAVLLHYYSTRGSGLTALVVGIVRESASLYFQCDLEMDIVSTELKENSAFHAIWRIVPHPASRAGSHLSGTTPSPSLKTATSPPSLPTSLHLPCSTMLTESLKEEEEEVDVVAQITSPTSPKCPFSAIFGRSVSQDTVVAESDVDVRNRSLTLSTPTAASAATQEASTSFAPADSGKKTGISLSSDDVSVLFPFHVALDSNMQIVQVGAKLKDYLSKDSLEQNPAASKYFQFLLPQSHVFSWANLKQLRDTSVELVLLSDQAVHGDNSRNSCPHPQHRDIRRFFRGQVYFPQAGDAVLLLLSPEIRDTRDLKKLGLALNDLPLHSFQRDNIMIGEQLKSESSDAVNLSKLSKQLDRESRKSQDALKTKRVFVRYVSHEIRTPLSIALLGLRYLEDVLRTSHRSNATENTVSAPAITMSEADFEVLEDVKGSCMVAVDILNDLLLYERLDDGIFTLSKRPVQLLAYVDEAMRAFKLLAKSAEVDLQLEIDPTVAEETTVEIDAAKIQQVLRNLVSNSLKFTPKHGQVTICVRSLTSDAIGSDNVIRHEDIVFAGSNTSSEANDKDSSSAHTSAAAISTGSDSAKDSSSSPPKHYQLVSASQSADNLLRPQPLDLHARSYVRIVVRDTGHGISQEDQRTLFGEFAQVQAEKLQNGQGSGLGLWISSNLVKLHGGRIGVYSEGEEKGASFLIDLPYFVIDSSSALTPNRSKKDSGVAKALRHSLLNAGTNDTVDYDALDNSVDNIGIDHSVHPDNDLQRSQLFRLLSASRVLIVDDSAINRKMVVRVMADKFAHCEEAENGLEAVNKCERALALGQPFHVIMMDCLMPVMNGLEASRRIRCFDSQVVIVGVTGNALDSDREVFLAAGADHVMVKPLSLPHFLGYLQDRGFVLA